MKRPGLWLLAALCVSALTACWAAVSDDVVVDGYPPDGFIATATPVYYEGHAAYWYGGRWFYREGGGWRGYRSEPPGLQQVRVRAEPQRAYYGRAHGGGYRPHR